MPNYSIVPSCSQSLWVMERISLKFLVSNLRDWLGKKRDERFKLKYRIACAFKCCN